LFAIGVRALAMPGGNRTHAADASSDRLVGGSPIGLVAGSLCILIVLAAIGWGIWVIYETRHGH
jgi:hypothetical protein